jgi:hypothetical protein
VKVTIGISFARSTVVALRIIDSPSNRLGFQTPQG